MAGTLLEHLATVARDARLHAGRRQIDIATTAGVAHTTVSHFEAARGWPLNPERLIAAYAEEVGCEPIDLWHRALGQWEGGTS